MARRHCALRIVTALLIAVAWAAAQAGAGAELPPRRDPIVQILDEHPRILPRDEVTAIGAPMPMPMRIEESHPANFPPDYPADPPMRTAGESANNLPVASGARSPSPPGRWLHTCVATDGKMVCYGGVANSAALFNDLWAYDYANAEWVQLEAPSAPKLPSDPVQHPPSRDAGAEGRPPTMPPPPPMRLPPGVPRVMPSRSPKIQSADLTSIPTVRLAPVPGATPTGVDVRSMLSSFVQLSAGAQGKAAARAKARARFDALPHVPNDVWVYDVVDRVWTQLPSPIVQPPPRWMHSAVVVESTNMLIFGGCMNTLLLANDLWTLDMAAGGVWSEITVTGTLPDPREGHAAVVLPKEKQMLVFGGMSYAYRPYDELWSLDLSGKSWTKVEAASPPPARWMHSVTLVKEGAALAVYGGCSANFAPLDDLWIFDVASQAWSMVAAPLGFPPAARWLHAAVTLPSGEGELLLIHGGAANNMALDDMWAFHLADESWMEIHPAGNAPFAREGHTLVLAAEAPPVPGGRRRLQAAAAARDPPFDPPVVKYMGNRAENRTRYTAQPTLWLLAFGGASERGLVASAQDMSSALY